MNNKIQPLKMIQGIINHIVRNKKTAYDPLINYIYVNNTSYIEETRLEPSRSSFSSEYLTILRDCTEHINNLILLKCI